MSKAKKKNKGKYLGRFKYDVCVNDYGISGELFDWCEKYCKGRWGWWFDNGPEWHHWNPEQNIAYISFSHRRDAVRFWFENVKVMEENRESR